MHQHMQDSVIMDIYRIGDQWNENENTDLGVADYDAASRSPEEQQLLPWYAGPVDADTGMHKVVIIAKLSKL